MSEQVEAITALTQQLASDNLATWSEDKKKSFVSTFDSRIRVARFILIKTAKIVADKAHSKHFISAKHTAKFPSFGTPEELYDGPEQGYNSRSDKSLIGGRTVGELKQIAEERALEIVDKLPGLSNAVRIVSPEIAKKIDQRTKLVEDGKRILNEANDLTGAVDMAEVDQNMTVAGFRQFIKDRELKRKKLVAKLDQLGIDGRELDTEINKFLYHGLPGLSEAVVKVVSDYMDRATAFSALNRRVGEQVQFGDSEAALEMLKSFEKDEVAVSSEIQASFDQALEQLKLAAKKGLTNGTKAKKGLTAGKAS